jgi:hypothetical protein
MKTYSSEQTVRRVLLADIGGTLARFAILADGSVRDDARHRRPRRSCGSQWVSGPIRRADHSPSDP